VREYPEKMLRLALLLSGGGAAARRFAAGVVGSSDFPSALEDAGAPKALLSEMMKSADGPAASVLDKVHAAGWRWIIPGDPDFPELLKGLSDPPLGLFVRGSLLPGVCIALVGSRKASSYGLRAARMLAERVAAAGGIVVSGMARGIDAAAHEGALAAGGRTWAVWGTGPDRIYPSEHGKLAVRIAEQGALMTEFPPGAPPRPHHFLQRNRLVAGLCRATVVVEAAARSGALQTARQALDEGREVLAVPGSIFSEYSVGPNALLRAGATPLVSAADLLEVLGISAGAETAQTPHPLDGILGEGEALGIDELAQRMKKPVAQILSWVLELELEGWIRQTPDGRYRQCRPDDRGKPAAGSGAVKTPH